MVLSSILQRSTLGKRVVSLVLIVWNCCFFRYFLLVKNYFSVIRFLERVELSGKVIYCHFLTNLLWILKYYCKLIRHFYFHQSYLKKKKSKSYLPCTEAFSPLICIIYVGYFIALYFCSVAKLRKRLMPIPSSFNYLRNTFGESDEERDSVLKVTSSKLLVQPFHRYS